MHMHANETMIYLLLYLVIASVCQASHVTTLHLDSTAGDTLYLPCLDAPDEIIPIWSIHGQIYSSSSIGYYFNAEYIVGKVYFFKRLMWI